MSQSKNYLITQVATRVGTNKEYNEVLRPKVDSIINAAKLNGDMVYSAAQKAMDKFFGKGNNSIIHKFKDVNKQSIVGILQDSFDEMIPEGIATEIEGLFEKNNYRIECYLENSCINLLYNRKEKITRVLYKLLRNTHTLESCEFFKKKYEEFLTFRGSVDSSSLNSDDFIIYYTRDPHEVIQMSYNKPWTSCFNIQDGIHRHKLFDEIRHGGFVAYLLRSLDDLTKNKLRNPLSRLWIRRITNSRNESYFVCEQKAYSVTGETIEISFIENVERFLSKYQGIILFDDFELMGSSYSDTLDSIIEHGVYGKGIRGLTAKEIDTFSTEELVTSFCANLNYGYYKGSAILEPLRDIYKYAIPEMFSFYKYKNMRLKNKKICAALLENFCALASENLYNRYQNILESQKDKEVLADDFAFLLECKPYIEEDIYNSLFHEINVSVADSIEPVMLIRVARNLDHKEFAEKINHFVSYVGPNMEQAIREAFLIGLRSHSELNPGSRIQNINEIINCFYIIETFGLDELIETYFAYLRKSIFYVAKKVIKKEIPVEYFESYIKELANKSGSLNRSGEIINALKNIVPSIIKQTYRAKVSNAIREDFSSKELLELFNLTKEFNDDQAGCLNLIRLLENNENEGVEVVTSEILYARVLLG